MERHGHTLDATPAGPDLWGLDATVFWPHVDLRIAPPTSAVHLAVTCRADTLHLEVRGVLPMAQRVELREIARNDNGSIRQTSSSG